MKYLIIILISLLSTIGFASREKPDYEDEITWLIPDDGGTPRDPGRIIRLSYNEFQLLFISIFQEMAGEPTLITVLKRVCRSGISSISRRKEGNGSK